MEEGESGSERCEERVREVNVRGKREAKKREGGPIHISGYAIAVDSVRYAHRARVEMSCVNGGATSFSPGAVSSSLVSVQK